MPSKELKDALSNIIWGACAQDEKPISDSVDEILSTILAALQEPTEGMLKAGATGSGEDSEVVAAGAWRAMLKASALGEQSDG